MSREFVFRLAWRRIVIGRVVATASWWRARRSAETALLAAASVLARRTLFRYFERKEDVLFQAIDAFGDRVAGAVHVRPAEEPVWNTIRASMSARVRQRAWSHVLEHPMGVADRDEFRDWNASVRRGRCSWSVRVIDCETTKRRTMRTHLSWIARSSSRRRQAAIATIVQWLTLAPQIE